MSEPEKGGRAESLVFARNPENSVPSSIVNAGNWPTPLSVYGYSSSWNVAGGDLYEAQTRCLDCHW